MTISTETILKELVKKLESKQIKFFFIDKRVNENKKWECLLKAPSIKIKKIGELKEVGKDQTLFAKEYDPNWNKTALEPQKPVIRPFCVLCKEVINLLEVYSTRQEKGSATILYYHSKCRITEGTTSTENWDGKISNE